MSQTEKDQNEVLYYTIGHLRHLCSQSLKLETING